MASSTNNIDLFVDETYLIALLNEEPLPISDEKYAHEITLQEALFSSSSSSLSSFSSTSNPEQYYSYDFPTPSKTIIEKISPELGESSQTKQIFCGICMDPKQPLEIFPGLSKCNHAYCTDCVTKYVTSKIKENIALVDCPFPKCTQNIEPENCINILPKEVFGMWENALCEALILGGQKFYCPYNECSAMMVNDGDEVVRQSECPSCRRLFCASCRVKWHVGFTCEEFQGLGEDERGSDDLMVMRLAKDKEWRRCSNCNFYVEKIEGCLHMTCRCRYEFCYKCGGKWSSGHDC